MSNYDINWEEYFKPDHWWKLDEESGIVVPDSGKTPALDGVNNGPTDINKLGKVGKCYGLDGTSSECLAFANNGTFQLGFNYTFTAWIYMNSVSGAPRILSKSATGADYDWWWQLAAGPKLHTGAFMEDATNVSYLSTGQTFVTGRWYFICAVFTGDLFTFYIDGEFDDAGIGTPQPGKRPRDTAVGVNIGRHFSGGNPYYDFNGRIDDVRIYNDKALSVSEIKQLYDYTNNYRNQPVPIIHKPTHDKYTKLYLPFDGDLYDESESGHSVNPAGDIVLSNAKSKFGSYSAYFPGVDVLTNYLSASSSPDWDLGTDDFTIDMQLWLPTGSIYGVFLSHGIIETDGSWALGYDNTPRLFFYYAGVSWVATGATTPFDQWFHLALVRSGNNLTSYINGVLQETVAFAFAVTDVDKPLYIGSDQKYIVNSLLGYMADLRISNIARWTSAFTPPTAPYESTRYINLYRDKQDLVTQWPVHRWKLNEIEGMNVIDTGLIAINGTNNGAIINQEGYRQGKCYWFDNAYVDFGNINSFERTDSFSISIWVKTPSDIDPTIQQSFVNKMINEEPGRGYDFGMMVGKTFHFMLINDNAGANYAGINTVKRYDDNIWHHVVATYDGSSNVSGMRIYVDAELQAVVTIWNTLSATIVDTTPFRIGNRSGTVTLHINYNWTQDVQVYGSELTVLEIQRIYQSGLLTNALGDYCAKYHPSLLDKLELKAVRQERFSGAILPEKPRTVDPNDGIIIDPGVF